MTEVEKQAAEVDALVAAIKPILAGKNPQLQGALLAELTAIWVWGNQIPGNAEATKRLRRDIIHMQNKAILEMVELFDAAGGPV